MFDIATLLNLNCGDLQRDPSVSGKLIVALVKNGFLRYEATRSIDEVEPALEKLLGIRSLGRKLDILFVVGGDGTQGITINYLLKLQREKGYEPPVICPLPFGSGDFISHSLGFRDPFKSIKKVGKLDSLETRTIQTLELEFDGKNPLGDSGPMNCFMALFGSAFYNFYELYNSNGRNFKKFVKMISKLAPGAITNSEYFQQVWGASAFNVRVDGNLEHGINYIPGIITSSVEISAFGLKPFSVEPDKVNYLGAQLDRLEMLYQFGMTFVKKPKSKNLRNLQAEHVCIDKIAKENNPPGAVFDGDNREYKGPVIVRPGPTLQALVLR